MEQEGENGEVCYTELCLSPIGQRRSSTSSSPASRRGKAPESKQEEDGNITIFYNGRICICDVTEIQARAIIRMAKEEMEVEINNDDNKSDTLERRLEVPPSLLLNQSPSMKRSLHQFLQKRKTRRSL